MPGSSSTTTLKPYPIYMGPTLWSLNHNQYQIELDAKSVILMQFHNQEGELMLPFLTCLLEVLVVLPPYDISRL